MADPVKCTRETRCLGMDMYCDIDESYRGIHSAEPFDLEKMEPTGELFFYYRTKKADRGLVLNYCPWCGSELNKFRKKAGKND